MNAVKGSDSGVLDPRWQSLLTFAVGETTARLVRDNLQLSPQGSSAGNGVTLAPIIIGCRYSKSRILVNVWVVRNLERFKCEIQARITST